MGETRLEHSSPARCRIRVTVRPLPFRPPPERDELLSSWISRLAKANHCATEELCGYLGLGPGRVPECASELRVVHWALLCAALRRTPDEIVAMALPDTIHLPVQCVSRHDFQYCPGCVEKTPDLVLRHWRFAWALTCETCGQALAAKYPAKEVSGRLRARAVRGAEALKTAVANSDLRRLHRMYLTLYVVSMLGAGHTASVISANAPVRTCETHGVPLRDVRRGIWDDIAHELQAMMPEIQTELMSPSESAPRSASALQSYVVDRIAGKQDPEWLDCQDIDQAARATEMLGGVIAYDPERSV